MLNLLRIKYNSSNRLIV